MMRIDAQRRKASAERFKHSPSLASLRHLLSQLIVRSTIDHLGRTVNLLAASDRFTISTLTHRTTGFKAAWNCGS
jgi:hypothetical protein